MLRLLLTVGPEWLWHPLGQCSGTAAEVVRCKSYNFHSGLVGELQAAAEHLVYFVAAVALFYAHHRCTWGPPRGPRCRRLGHANHGHNHGHPLCHHHAVVAHVQGGGSR